MESQPPSTEPAAHAQPTPPRAIAAWIAAVLVLYAFLLVMAHYEPVTGDGWAYAGGQTLGLGKLFKAMVALHNIGNPRISQLFTILTYGSTSFHLVVTPLMTLLLLFMVFFHAVGRWPRFDSSRDLLLFSCGTALCWLAVPWPGQIYFYRPITTNYVYSLALSLLLLMPFRRPPALKYGPSAIALAVVMLLIGALAGMMNEHTGPTWVVVTALCALLAYRRGDRGDACWMTSTSAGLLAGWVFLFTAPGLRHRHGSKGAGTVFDTVLNRGVSGNFELLNRFCRDVGPALLFVLLSMLVFGVLRGSKALEDTRQRSRTIAVYPVVAAMILGTSFAAPIHHYRLFVAPAVLLVIAGVAALELIAAERGVRVVLWAASIAVNVGFMAILLRVYSEIHADDEARTATLAAAKPGQKVQLMLLRHGNEWPYFYGDTVMWDRGHLDRLAHIHGLDKRDILVRPPKRVRALRPETRARAIAKAKAKAARAITIAKVKAARAKAKTAKVEPEPAADDPTRAP